MIAWLHARLIAPGSTAGDRVVCYGGALAGSVLATVIGARAGLSGLPLAVIAFVAFDLYGGAAANATAAAKRRFHGPGRTWRQHLGFVAIHVQPFVVALVVPGFGWGAAAGVYALAVSGAAVVLAVPAASRRPAGFAVTALAITVAVTLLDVPRELGWFAPVLLIKLLLAHLQPEGDG